MSLQHSADLPTTEPVLPSTFSLSTRQVLKAADGNGCAGIKPSPPLNERKEEGGLGGGVSMGRVHHRHSIAWLLETMSS